ncbi:hypothetical protein NC652_040602 [Populus alba x Populus x berolinensis]|uniref:Uncharacterized protein n=1 Tax=Populus alba x Populus x berolinensis TaxID=444605 RepID=A0AAD6L738_9ROSI|nr:hypothetical protein NC652_040601 [Populus alba x Populus x berolinensis]KAJ6858105.1 hypothetical protein NC652_040602 [Populus alba x Populus x berolinensis]KAJ6951408.1 hypothetical protein NC653_040735 [Populus alba x Populus x berolinensis]
MEGASFKICGRQASRVQITHGRVLMDQGLPIYGCVPLNEHIIIQGSKSCLGCKKYNFAYRKQKQTIDI